MSFYITSNEFFYLRKIYDLLKQNNISVTHNKNKSFFKEINFKIEKNIIKISISENQIEIKTPTNINTFYSELIKLLKSVSVKVNKIEYFPILNQIDFNNNKINLGVIHNTIFSNLLLNLKGGVDKVELYKMIWPNDKEIHINKLDTHLTNLKSTLSDKLKLNLKIYSDNQNVILSI